MCKFEINVTAMTWDVVKCSLNHFCKNHYLKSKINDVILNMNKIIFEGHLLANLHVIPLLQEEKQVPCLNQKLFKICYSWYLGYTDDR